MEMKKFFSLVFMGIVSMIIFLQVSNLQVANAVAPITSPISGFVIAGHVDYKNLFRLFGGLQRFFPASGVTVTFTEFFNKNVKFSTTTDADGNYVMPLDPSLYKVEVSDANHTFFSPHTRVIKLNTASKSADFTGLIFRP
jgi:hypothetical protein